MVDGARVWIDGESRPPSDAKISVFDRGFLYADSVFEVVRAYRGVPFALVDHVARLRRSASKLAIDLPWSDDALAAEVRACVRESGIAEAYVRLTVTRGAGPLGVGLDDLGAPTRVLIVAPVRAPAPDVYDRGITAWATDRARETDDRATAGAKVSSYVGAILALRDARAKGAQEALFCRVESGTRAIVEGATSNVLAIVDGRLRAPCGPRVLAGITRARLLACAERLGVAIDDAPIAVADLDRAEALMIASTIRELVPVTEVLDGDRRVRIAAGVVGEDFRALHAALRADIEAEITADRR